MIDVHNMITINVILNMSLYTKKGIIKQKTYTLKKPLTPLRKFYLTFPISYKFPLVREFPQEIKLLGSIKVKPRPRSAK